MAATTNQLVALKNDGVFRERTRTLIRQICAQMYSESPDPQINPNHAQRASFAIALIQGKASLEPIIDALVTRTNLVGSTVAYDFDHTQVTTTATDADILSQIASDWNFFAGIS